MKEETFKAETKQLLDLVINSIYTNREIFLRELISNASDAIDKLKFKSLTEPELLKEGGDFEIRIQTDNELKTLTISDNGIGMTYDEVIENIGTIAKSGSKEFFEKIAKESGGDEKNAADAAEFIGEFGVGFYSAFMVADKVKIKTKFAGADSKDGVVWESKGDGVYTVGKAEIEKRGTEIVLYLKDELLKEMDLLDKDELEKLVVRYSDFIRYPIKMFVEKEIPEEKDKDGKVIKEKESVVEDKTLNSMKPIWKREKSDVTTEEYKEFYRHSFHSYDEPVDIIQMKGEGQIEYTALLFIPSEVPFNFYSASFERGLALYSKQVFIMEKCKDLVPEYLGFVKGIVDSPDFSLNISREILQHTAQLKLISKNIEKKILASLKYMLENEREKYIKFWNEFGRAIKAGIYSDFGMNKEKLQDLLLFESSCGDALTTLAEYVKRMPEKQKEIYYAAGKKEKEALSKTPQMEAIVEKGYEVLYFTDKIDEFTSSILVNYQGKPLKNIAAGDLNLDTEEEKKEKEEKRKEIESESKSLLETLKKHLENEVAEIRLSTRLKSSAVCLVSGEGVSLNMEQVLSEAATLNMPVPKAKRILEINPEHSVFAKLNEIYKANPESPKLKEMASVLYGQALLIEGVLPKNPVEFANQISRFLSEIPA